MPACIHIVNGAVALEDDGEDVAVPHFDLVVAAVFLDGTADDGHHLLGARVDTRLPVVVGQQEADGLVGVRHVLEPRVRTLAIALGGLGLLQHVMADAGRTEGHEVNGHGVGVREREAAGRVGDARADELLVSVRSIRLVQLELGALNALAQLIDLGHGARRDIHQVVLEAQVGRPGPALKVVELEGVIRARLERSALKILATKNFLQ